MVEKKGGRVLMLTTCAGQMRFSEEHYPGNIHFESGPFVSDEGWCFSWDQLEEAILNYFSRGLAHPAVARAVMQRAEDLEKENEVLTAKVDEFRHGEEQFKIQLKNAMQVIQNENQQIENLREANVKCKENYDRMSIALTTIRDQRSEQILKFLKDLEKWVNVNCTEPTPTKPGILYTVLIREKLRGMIREAEVAAYSCCMR